MSSSERRGRRVVVTGLGVISALGPDRQAFWKALSEGRHGFRPLRGVDTAGLQFEQAAQVLDFDPGPLFERSRLDLLDRFAQLWMAAAREATDDSGLDAARLEEAAIVNGTSLGGQMTQDELYAALYRDGRRRITPFAVPKIMANSAASHFSMECGVTGPTFTLTSACSSSNHAIGLAYWMVASGMVDRAVTGGSEAPFCLGHLKAWDSLRVVAPDSCRPFSLGRKGLILAEGGAALVLESLDSARARGARIYAELVGFGMSADASHVTKPSAAGARRAMAAALEDAGLAPERVDYVNAHGTGTLLNDQTEAEAIVDLFGDHTSRLLVSSTKSMHGHALGAAGALEAVATLLALEQGLVPPTANFLEADPACPLRVVPNQALEARVEVALSATFAFGGLNAVVAFRRFE